MESEVIAYTKLLVQNEQFAEDIQKQIGQKVDLSGIDVEIANYRKRLMQLERSKNNLERDIDDIHSNDRNAKRKREDMNRRLDGIYDEMTDIENSIADCEQMKASAEQKALRQIQFTRCYWILTSLLIEWIKQTSANLLRRSYRRSGFIQKETWEKGKSPVKEIRYAFPVSDEILGKMQEKLQPWRQLSYCISESPMMCYIWRDTAIYIK